MVQGYWQQYAVRVLLLSCFGIIHQNPPARVILVNEVQLLLQRAAAAAAAAWLSQLTHHYFVSCLDLLAPALLFVVVS
jgi:hypothetical protein